MLIVIDIGNTNITIGIYKDDKLIGNYRLTTKMKRTSDEYGFMILNFLSASKPVPMISRMLSFPASYLRSCILS